MNDETLISCVQEFPCLYAKSDKNFMNSAKKRLAWGSIAGQLGISDGEACEKRWRNLRDQFTREHRRLTYPAPSGSSSTATWKKPWDLYPSMSFLLEHVKHKQTLTSSSAFSPIISSSSKTPAFPNLPTTSTLEISTPSVLPTLPTPSSSRVSTPTLSSTSTSTPRTSTPDHNYIFLDPDISLDLEITSMPNDQGGNDTGRPLTAALINTTDTNSSSDSNPKASKRPFFSPSPDVFKRPKKDDGLDKMLGDATSMVEKTMTILNESMTKATVTKDNDDELFTSVRAMFRMVPEKEKPDCLIELLQVVRKYVKW